MQEYARPSLRALVLNASSSSFMRRVVIGCFVSTPRGERDAGTLVEVMAIYWGGLVMHYMASMVQKTEIVNDVGIEIRSSIGARLKEERERLGYSQIAFAALGGASKGSQLAWEKGAATPNAEFLHVVGSAGVDVLYVVTGQRNLSNPAPDEEMVLAGFRKLDARGRAGVLALIGGMQDQSNANVRIKGDVGQYVEGNLKVTQPFTINVGKGKKRE